MIGDRANVMAVVESGRLIVWSLNAAIGDSQFVQIVIEIQNSDNENNGGNYHVPHVTHSVT